MSDYFQVFLGSSTEHLNVAKAISAQLDYIAEVRIWTDEFAPSSNTLVALLSRARTYDYGLFLLTPDDTLTSREKTFQSPRDNIIFELGLFCGVLGKDRTIAIKQRNVANLKIPSDLDGITILDYDPTKQIDNAVRKAAYDIENHMKLYGKFREGQPDVPPERPDF